MLTKLIRSVCLGCLLVPMLVAGAELDFIVERDVMIPMRDGVKLASDIYRPAVDGQPLLDPLPVVLTRSPYNKERAREVSAAENFARHGYIAVVQDMRGRWASEGQFTKYAATEPMDGYDTVEWLAAQPFCNGNIGMWGTSYSAHTAADAAKLAPEALKAILINQGGMANAWDHAVRQGGAFELGRELSWVWRQIGLEYRNEVVRGLFKQEQLTDWYRAMPLKQGLSPLSHAPEYEKYFLDELRNSDYSAFWRTMPLNWSEYYEQTADIPMLHVGGWYDIFLRGTLQNYTGLSSSKRSSIEVLIGPWSHSGNGRTYAGDVDFGSDAALLDFFVDFQRRWFDRHLKSAVGTTPKPVRLFVMGGGDGRKNSDGKLRHGGYWIEADEFPLPEATETRFYLSEQGQLTEDKPVVKNAATSYTFDPLDPVPTIGGNVSARVKDGAYHQRERVDFFQSEPPYLPLSARDDVLVFQTEPLAADVTVIGPIKVVLYAESTGLDTDFTAKLVDVYPSSSDYPGGFAMNISDAVIRASYRGGREKRDLIRPGKIYEFVVEPFPTANIFKKGHRIRLDISSSNFPRFDVNPGTGEPLGINQRQTKVDNTIYHNARYPSHLVLPILSEKPAAADKPR